MGLRSYTYHPCFLFTQSQWKRLPLYDGVIRLLTVGARSFILLLGFGLDLALSHSSHILIAE